jgi:hypothetical protein
MPRSVLLTVENTLAAMQEASSLDIARREKALRASS